MAGPAGVLGLCLRISIRRSECLWRSIRALGVSLRRLPVGRPAACDPREPRVVTLAGHWLPRMLPSALSNSPCSPHAPTRTPVRAVIGVSPAEALVPEKPSSNTERCRPARVVFRVPSILRQTAPTGGLHRSRVGQALRPGPGERDGRRGPRSRPRVFDTAKCEGLVALCARRWAKGGHGPSRGTQQTGRGQYEDRPGGGTQALGRTGHRQRTEVVLSLSGSL